jgi:hypothetical protein
MKKLTILSLAICAAIITGLACKLSTGQSTWAYVTDEDFVIFDKYMAEMKPKKDLPMGQLITESALFFLGVPYVESTLEKELEGLVVNLREMDCATLVDNAIALSRTIKSDKPTFGNFCLHLQQLRYRKGFPFGYLSRLHYTSDWIYVNDKRKIVRDINKEIGGIPLKLDVSFMSTHPDSYLQLKGNPPLIERIAETEKEINARTTYYFIPRDKVDASAGKMQPGDVVCFTTAIKGLDTSHVGIIYKEGNRLTFIHASSLQKKVVVESATLKEYVRKGKNTTGIMLARPL